MKLPLTARLMIAAILLRPAWAIFASNLTGVQPDHDSCNSARLISAIKNGNRTERDDIIQILRKSSEQFDLAVPGLKKAVTDDDARVVFWCYVVLESHGVIVEPNVDFVTRAILAPDRPDHVAAVQLATRMRSKAYPFARPLAALVGDDSTPWTSRFDAAIALGEIGPAANGHMRTLLRAALMKERSWTLTMPLIARRTLEKVLQDDSIDFLLLNMVDRKLSTSERVGAIRILSRCLVHTDPAKPNDVYRAVQSIVQVLADSAESPLVRAEAALALGWAKLDSEQSRTIVPILKKMTDDSDARLRHAAVLGMEGAGSAALPVLVGLLDQADFVVYDSACGLLGKLGPVGEKAIDNLLVHLMDAEPARRAAAARAIGGIGSNTCAVVSMLKKALTDTDIRVREEAKDAIDRILSREGEKKGRE